MDLLQIMENKFPELVTLLKTTSHNIPSVGYVCKHHQEENIWEHIQLMFDYYKEDNIDVQLAILLHDIGKVYSRQIVQTNDDKYKPIFAGHGSYSTLMCGSILNMLQTEYSIQPRNLSNVLKVINWHDDIWRNEFSLNHYTKSTSEFLKLFAEIDAMGVISPEELKKESLGIIAKNFSDIDLIQDIEETIKDESKPHLIYLVGVPCSGKTSFINTYLKGYNNYTICSSDELIRKLSIMYGLTYQDIFNNKELMRKVTKEHRDNLNRLFSDHKNIIIDRTNINRDIRKEFLRIAKENNYFIEAYVIIPNLNDIFDRNSKRIEKNMSIHTLYNFIMKLTIPYKDEADIVHLVMNNTIIE